MSIVAIGIYRFQQSSSYIKLGNQALLAGKLYEAQEYYSKAHDAFPYRPAVSKILEGYNIYTEGGDVYTTPAPMSTPTLTPIPTIVPTQQVAPQIPLKEVNVPILMYHHIRINPLPQNPVWAALFVAPQQLQAQLEYLSSNGYTTVTLNDIIDALDGKKILPQKPIVLTFDDGYQSFYDNAYPLLKKHNMQATEFVITDVVGSGVYLTWNEIKEMYASHLITIGDHTKHHPFLTRISNVLAQDEIMGSKKDLEKQLNAKVDWFAYPYGDYNQQIIGIVQASGYKGAVSTIYGQFQKKDTLFIMPRILVDGRWNILTFSKNLQ